MDTLRQLCAKHYKNGWPDKDTIHSYIDVYEELLKPYRSEARNILEIGLLGGESHRMWIDYFEGTVYGIDCDLKPLNGQFDLTDMVKNFNVVIGDATNPEHIKKHFEGIKFDVIIEDAGHDIAQQFKIYETLFPYLSRTGIYIIEDVQDIDKTKSLFTGLGGHVIDRRNVKGRYDDVIVIFEDPAKIQRP